MTKDEHQPIAANCPRCGYDQRGVIATWKESCPLTGVCTECGLAFVWCEVLRPEKFEPRWCIEFEPKARRLVWAAMRTYFRSFLPWQFWSRLKMSDAIHWRRLLAYVLLLLLLLLLLYVVIQVGLAAWVRLEVEEGLAQEARMRPAAIRNLQAARQQYAAIPLTGDTYHDQQVQAQIAYFTGEIARQQALGTASEYIDSSWLATTWEALTQPLSSSSSVTIMSPAGMASGPYVPPSRLFLVVTEEMITSDWLETITFTVPWLAWGAGITVLLPFSFVLMPLSLRKAKVRWAHIVRVTGYSMFIPITYLLLAVVTVVSAAILSSDATLDLVAAAARYVPWLAIALWWHAATSRYLKIPHAWLTISLLTLMCLLILLAITAAISQELAWQMLDLFGPLIR
jgi:hypothetical protein